MTPFDAERDLVLEREVPISAMQIWSAWTDPQLVKRWFTPAPWQTVECDIDLRPGGAFRTRMRGPEGQEFDNSGCYLEIVPGRRLVWTGALGPGFRPRHAPPGSFLMTAVISLSDTPAGARYVAQVLHADAAARQQHEAMGFHVGWGKALDQMVQLFGNPG